MATFALLVPGRAVDTNFQQVDPNKFLVTITDASTINHIVLFLTGVVPIPLGTAACIFFSLPDPNAPPTWNFLGHLTNEKPSAIYRISNLKQSYLRNGPMSDGCALPGQMGNGIAFNYAQAPVVNFAQVGISIEPLSSVSQMVPAIEPASNVNTFTEFMNKTVNNLFNYCSSFSRSATDLIGNPFRTDLATNDAQYIPLAALRNWYENYSRRLSNDQNFWKTLN